MKTRYKRYKSESRYVEINYVTTNETYDMMVDKNKEYFMKATCLA